jgi:hypothetical protein
VLRLHIYNEHTKEALKAVEHKAEEAKLGHDVANTRARTWQSWLSKLGAEALSFNPGNLCNQYGNKETQRNRSFEGGREHVRPSGLFLRNRIRSN